MIPWLAAGVIGFLAYREFLLINVLAYVGNQNIWASRRFIAFLAVAALSLLVYGSLLRQSTREKLCRFFENIGMLPCWLKFAIGFVAVIFPGLVKWNLPLPENFTVGFWMEFFLITLCSALSASLFWDAKNSLGVNIILISSFILASGAAHSILYKFNLVTDYPFTLYWSEGNRFFDYSTLFGSFRYNIKPGEDIKAFISWGMQLPWAVPFVLPKISIGFYRFWYQLMWILPSLILGVAAIWQTRANKVSAWFIAVFALWTYLFLDQGPIYAPLVIGAILTVIAIRQKTLIGMLIVFAASYYTHSARWTWSYSPGLWAGLLALLEMENPTLKKADLPCLLKPIGLGIAGYLGGHLLPLLLRALKSEAEIRLLPDPTASTTRQPLLWERLFPNPTFPPGILGALVWATLPLIGLLIALILTKKWHINWLQKTALLIISGSFLIAGIIASVKIGGGSNLHNLDMFLVTLALSAASAAVYISRRKKASWEFSSLLTFLLIAALVAPVTYTLVGGSRLSLPPDEKIQESLAAVQNKVEEYSQQGEILFIDHRQLLTFGLVKNVPLVDEYEKKYLMDQAMAANAKYFSTFYEDLKNQRFALIVNEPTNIIIRGSEYSFGEENDAYVHWVTKPLLCAYEPIYTSQETSVELLVPRESMPPGEMNCQEIFNP